LAAWDFKSKSLTVRAQVEMYLKREDPQKFRGKRPYANGSIFHEP